MTLDIEEVMNAVERDDYTGFCRACGFEQDGCEPDMRKGECANCGKHAVYGAEELCLMLM